MERAVALAFVIVERVEGRSGRAGAVIEEDGSVVDAVVVEGCDEEGTAGAPVLADTPAPAPARSQGLGGDGVAIMKCVVDYVSLVLCRGGLWVRRALRRQAIAWCFHSVRRSSGGSVTLRMTIGRGLVEATMLVRAIGEEKR